MTHRHNIPATARAKVVQRSKELEDENVRVRAELGAAKRTIKAQDAELALLRDQVEQLSLLLAMSGPVRLQVSADDTLAPGTIVCDWQSGGVANSVTLRDAGDVLLAHAHAAALDAERNG